MVTDASAKRQINVRLIHNGMQPGTPLDESSEQGQPVFRGAFAHGPPAGRFLYLAWKRVAEHEHPFGWRIKIPLSGIGWAEIRAAEKPGKCLAANVIGRRPHASEPIKWEIEALQKS
jgi:hypothetical protein